MKVKKLNEVNEELTSVHSVAFYDLMQEYRHSSIYDQTRAVEKYENIKDFIEKNYILKDETLVKHWLLEQDANRYNV